MKILVIGGTGLTGRLVTKKLEKAGHEVIIGSPSHGVDILTGEGLSRALHGTEIVIDLSNSSSPEEENAIRFFETAAKNLVKAESAAGIKHHVVLSIVGTDDGLEIGYLRAKKLQEDYIKNSGIPFTIIRSTQFHEHTDAIIAVQGNGDKVFVSKVDYQPIALEDVSDFIVRYALEEPQNSTAEIAGPVRRSMDDFVAKYIGIIGKPIKVVSDEESKYMHLVIPRSLLVPAGPYTAGNVYFEDWALSTLDK
ncbi:SDR family oxidoreductase [Sphingobacterium prati]|uniref:SDR family oxidoreductase n=1 Tax=Sphingobacterium prati TaxID=2737006 RepID=UPI001552F603|nr:NAD(P)H-binding protein [Sphingobacterium prati]NPE45921.1 NAD(P)H-binding protein [Sphingobacterium prati]